MILIEAIEDSFIGIYTNYGLKTVLTRETYRELKRELMDD